MTVSLVRIDDRLIHGQIVHVWIEFSKAQTLLVADDTVVKDRMQQVMLKLAAPKTIKLELLSIKDAAEYIRTHDENIFLILRNPKTMLDLINEGIELKEINLGNISMTKSATGRKTLLKNIHVEQTDVDCLRAIAAKGVSIYIKLVPDDKPIDAIELINKNY